MACETKRNGADQYDNIILNFTYSGNQFVGQCKLKLINFIAFTARIIHMNVRYIHSGIQPVG